MLRKGGQKAHQTKATNIPVLSKLMISRYYDFRHFILVKRTLNACRCP